MNRLMLGLPIVLASFTLACAGPAAVPAAQRFVDVVGPVVAAVVPADAAAPANRSLLTLDPIYPVGYNPLYPVGYNPLYPIGYDPLNPTGYIPIGFPPPPPPLPEMARVPYEVNRLDHIDIWIKLPQAIEFTLLGRLEHSGVSDADHTFTNVTLSNLLPYELYQVRLRAFQVDPGRGGTLVEVTAGSTAQGAEVENFSESTTVFTTHALGFNGTQMPLTYAANEQVYVPFRLKLADQVFNGRSNGNINAQNGMLNGNGLPVTLEQSNGYH